MIIDFCSIRLKRIQFNDIEMIRNWRNDEKIVRYMFFDQFITEKMQEDWFNSLADSDFYFLIEKDQNALGLINLSKENKEEASAHAGLFIYDERYWGTSIPVLASMAILRLAFKTRQLEKVYAKVLKANKVALKYNAELGFKSLNEELQVLEKENYTHNLQNLIERTENNFLKRSK